MISFKSLFKNQSKSLKDFSKLGVDMHSHVLPGLDDGAQNMEEAIKMLHQFQKWGFRKVIASPHIMTEHYPNTQKKIRDGLAELQKEASSHQISIEIEAAAEYYIDESFMKLIDLDEKLLSFSNGYILIETSTFYENYRLSEIIFQLSSRGLKPILAHPERYLYFKGTRKFEKLKQSGAQFQVNLLSLIGYYGREQKKLALELINENMVEYLATDFHRISQIKSYDELLNDRILSKVLTENQFCNGLL